MLKQEVVGCLCGKEETLRWKALCVCVFFCWFFWCKSGDPKKEVDYSTVLVIVRPGDS